MSHAPGVAGDDARNLTTVVVHQWQCDHLGHLNVRHYAGIFDDAIFVFWSRRRVSPNDAVVPVTADFRIGFHSEVRAGTVATIRSRVERVGSKSASVHFEMVDLRTGQLYASCDAVEVFFDRQRRESESIPASVRESLTE